MNKLIITPGVGFFSCCSVRLYDIIKYINNFNIFPTDIDDSNTFTLYRINNVDNYFDSNYNFNKNIVENNYKFNVCTQYWDYSNIDYSKICSIVKIYFSPSKHIIRIISYFEIKYNINYKNICVLFYRGNDKNRETKICGYDKYLDKALIIFNQNKNIQFFNPKR